MCEDELQEPIAHFFFFLQLTYQREIYHSSCKHVLFFSASASCLGRHKLEFNSSRGSTGVLWRDFSISFEKRELRSTDNIFLKKPKCDIAEDISNVIFTFTIAFHSSNNKEKMRDLLKIFHTSFLLSFSSLFLHLHLHPPSPLIHSSSSTIRVIFWLNRYVSHICSSSNISLSLPSNSPPHL